MERGHVLQAGGLQVLEAAVAVVVVLPLVEGQLADVDPHEATIGLVLHVDPDLFLHHRSEEHTSELQSLMRISYAVFCLKKKNTHNKLHKSARNTSFK